MASTDVEQENMASTRRGFEAFAKHDMATLADLFEPNATWRSAPTGILPGSYAGRDNIFAMFAQLGAETQGSFSSQPTAFAAAGDKVFALTRASGQRNGKSQTSEEILVFTFANGKVRDVQLFVYDHATSAEFWK